MCFFGIECRLHVTALQSFMSFGVPAVYSVGYRESIRVRVFTEKQVGSIKQNVQPFFRFNV